MNAIKERRVTAIENGTVIDHIPAENLFKVISIINVEAMDTQLIIGNNFKSAKLGKKGIIKIENKFPSIQDINKIALLAPDAIFNIIKDYQVVEKKQVRVPKVVENIAKCVNPKCITNFEDMDTYFYVIDNNGEIGLKCKYCEKITEQHNMIIV